MDRTKNYYSTLGVLPSAEPVVIRAAYRALAMQYHPDKWTGDKATAEARMRQLNEAYEILSNEQTRKQYDKTRQSQGFEEYDSENDSTQDAFRDAEKIQRTDWEVAVDYYPDLEGMYAELRKTSNKLAFAFRTTILETKKFSERKQLAIQLEERFLQTYFGKNPKILSFARTLIHAGRKEAAKELNRAISVLGSEAPEQVVIGRIQAKFFKEDLGAVYKSARELAEALSQTQYVSDAIALVERLGGKVTYGGLFSGFEVRLELHGGTHDFGSDYDMTQWVLKAVVPKTR